jgi:UMF1 family MFS transporter
MSINRKVWGWAIYDWANSAFATTVMAGFFPIFFKEFWSAGTDITISTARLGFANAGAGLLVALIAPVLGAIADKGAVKKKFLVFFAYLGVLMTAALFFVQKGEWVWAVFIYAMGSIGFSGANVFYDSLLPLVAGKNRIDYVSSLGYSLGYLGGGILFLFNVLVTLWPRTFGFADATAAVQFAFLSVALWWGLFSIITIAWLPKETAAPVSLKTKQMVREGFCQFFRTLKKVRRLKTIFLFLLAYWFYIDGVDTVIRMAIDYGLSIGFNADQLIVALLIVQFVSFPAALLFGKLGQCWGARRAIFLAIGIYMLITLWGTMMRSPKEFYILATFIGLVQGGIQSLSRSYYCRLIPHDKAAEFYGFYNMLGKFAAIFGPAIMGIVGLTAKWMLLPPSPSIEQMHQTGQTAARLGMGSILILFIAGGTLLYFVDENKGKQEATYLTEK